MPGSLAGVRLSAAGTFRQGYAAVEQAASIWRCAGILLQNHFASPSIGGGASGVGHTIFAKPPRCSSSRPFPPRPVTPYLVVLIVCSPPRVVSTVSRLRS